VVARRAVGAKGPSNELIGQEMTSRGVKMGGTMARFLVRFKSCLPDIGPVEIELEGPLEEIVYVGEQLDAILALLRKRLMPRVGEDQGVEK